MPAAFTLTRLVAVPLLTIVCAGLAVWKVDTDALCRLLGDYADTLPCCETEAWVLPDLVIEVPPIVAPPPPPQHLYVPDGCDEADRGRHRLARQRAELDRLAAQLAARQAHLEAMQARLETGRQDAFPERRRASRERMERQLSAMQHLAEELAHREARIQELRQQLAETSCPPKARIFLLNQHEEEQRARQFGHQAVEQIERDAERVHQMKREVERVREIHVQRLVQQ